MTLRQALRALCYRPGGRLAGAELLAAADRRARRRWKAATLAAVAALGEPGEREARAEALYWREIYAVLNAAARAAGVAYDPREREAA